MQPEVGHYSESAFDVDPKTGFMASRVPLGRLPASWELWEALLDSAINEKLQPGDIIGLPEEDAARSARWRERVRQTPVLPTDDLNTSPILLRRAHLVLTFLLHFYIQTLPPTSPILIPKPISIPILRVCHQIGMPPVITFADTVLYNWNLIAPIPSDDDFPPKPNNLRSQTLFTGLPDEEAFYLSSARIELRGVEALEIMRMTTDEISVGDTLAVGRITNLLTTLTTVIDDLRKLLLDVRSECDPDVYYNSVRPWFRGQDSDTHKRKWVFEGLSDLEREGEGISEPRELSGASAGQSSLVHALDCFLGVENVKTTTGEGKPSFMSRMQVYMPRNHRLFLDHLAKTERPLRGFVRESEDGELVGAFNKAVMALKEFRDSHMIIVTLYIIGPARRARQSEEDEKRRKEWKEERLKGTGGTDLVKFLKTTRTQTAETVLETCNVTTN
ncbi:hypothetical protein PM082_023695 [Marasmius tenuissimus]|nr:hypothetical protein PM082_023695 [Marasmius tenuissimus]